MITLPIIVLGALTGLSEGQTARTQRQLLGSKIVKDEWLKGQCQMGTSTRKTNIPVKEDCIQECSSFLGINYFQDEKKCYCIENLTSESYYDFEHRDCFIYGSCGRLDAEWCGSNQNCSWKNGSCSADRSGSEYDSALLAPAIKAELTKTAAASALPRCVAKFDGGGELPGHTQCRDRNLDQCQKKDLDANNECPGDDVWEQDPCAAKRLDTFGSVASQAECKNKCDEKKHIAINFSSEKQKCECIIEGDLYNYNNGDESATCFIYPEAEEDNASAAYCSGIKLLSECESSEDIKEECAKECATIRSNFTEIKLKEENDSHICDEVMECNKASLWGVCAHRCGKLYLDKKNGGTSPSRGSSKKREIIESEVRRQQRDIIDALEKNPGDDGPINKEKRRFEKLITETGTDGLTFKQRLEKLPMEQANIVMGGGSAFKDALISNDAGRVRTLSGTYLQTRDTARNRRALRLVNQSTTDDVVEIISHVTNVSDLFAEAGIGSDTFGSISATISLVEPMMGMVNSDNSAQGKFRSLVEFKLNLAAQVTAELGPVGSLFTFAHEITKGVNASEPCTNNGSRVDCNPEKLAQEIGAITLTAAIETIGNGHLGDLYNIFQMGQRVQDAGTLKAIDVADVMTLGAAAMRGGCAIATFAFPVAAVPCNVGVKLTEIVRDVGVLSNPTTEKFLDDVLVTIEKNPVVKKVLPVLGGAVKRITKVADAFAGAIGNVAVTVFDGVAKARNVLAAVATGDIDLVFNRNNSRAAVVAPRRHGQRGHGGRRGGGVQRIAQFGKGVVGGVVNGLKNAAEFFFGR